MAVQDLGLSTTHSCACCPADIHNFPYTEVSQLTAKWIPKCYNFDEFCRAFPNRCAVFDIDGVTHLTVGCDTMHNKHAGMDMYSCASVLYLLVYVMLPGIGCGFT